MASETSKIAPAHRDARSVRSTSMKPPPMAKPLTAAMTGFSSVPAMKGSSMRRAAAAGRAIGQGFLHVLAGAEAAAGAGEDGDLQLRVGAEIRPGLGEGMRNSWFSALMRSGRFMRTTRTWPCRSVSTTPIAIPPCVRTTAPAAPHRHGCRSDGVVLPPRFAVGEWFTPPRPPGNIAAGSVTDRDAACRKALHHQSFMAPASGHREEAGNDPDRQARASPCRGRGVGDGPLARRGPGTAGAGARAV